MKQIHLLLIKLLLFFWADGLQGMDCVCGQSNTLLFSDSVEITFNNYPCDTRIYINNGCANNTAQIEPTRKNIQLRGVQKVEVKKANGLLLRLWLIHELQTIKIITINKNTTTGNYVITVNSNVNKPT